MRTILKLSLVTSLFALVSGLAYGQELNNPNKLPPCPEADYSKKRDYERVAKWTNCWGLYKIELNALWKGDVLEGEWLNGHLHGLGTYTHSDGEKYAGEFKVGKSHGRGTRILPSGDKYVGEHKDDNRHGLGTYTYSNGNKYVGEFKDGKFNGQGTFTYSNGEKYVGEFLDNNFNGQGTHTYSNGGTYVGEFKDDKRNGLGTYVSANGAKYFGEHKDDKRHGQGIFTSADGTRIEGIWENGSLIRQIQVNLPEINSNIANSGLKEEKRKREQQQRPENVNLKVTHTHPAPDGSLSINIQTNADTASLKINGSEEGGSSDGKYNIRRIARAGQTTTFNIVATDVFGNTDTKTITVSRAVADSKATFAALNPENMKKQVERDAVAVVIGIADYRSLPKADFANDDARAFYDYAIRALGIKPENIKLLVDSDAEEAEILKTFRTWLPSRVKSTTDVYVFYSGHGLPMPDGKGLYLVPPRADREVIDDTAIPFSKLNAAITLAKPKSVTVFLDSCYSGQARSGETLVASARPVQFKSDSRYFPENFTVITASQNDQISSSNPDLQHGIFSYYLMKGMEGDADSNKDGKITLGEMQTYLTENVGRHAAMMSRKQEPQLIGDVNRVLVGR